MTNGVLCIRTGKAIEIYIKAPRVKPNDPNAAPAVFNTLDENEAQ